MRERLFKDRITSIFNLGGITKKVADEEIKVLGDKFTINKNLRGDKAAKPSKRNIKINALYDLSDILEKRNLVEKDLNLAIWIKKYPLKIGHIKA